MGSSFYRRAQAPPSARSGIHRELNEYRRTHDLPLVDPEDWKFWFYQGIDKRTH